MRIALFSLGFLFFVGPTEARESAPGEAFQRTIKSAILVEDSKLDPIGSKLIALGDGYELQGNCEKRSVNGDCSEMSFVLSVSNQRFAMLKANGEQVQKLNILRFKDDLSQKYLESLWRFQDFSKPIRQVGDFTGYIGVSCIFDKRTCGLLLLLPFAIAGDLAMLPIDIARNRIPQIRARNRVKKLIKGLSVSSDEEKLVSDSQFYKTFESLSEIEN